METFKKEGSPVMGSWGKTFWAEKQRWEYTHLRLLCLRRNSDVTGVSGVGGQTAFYGLSRQSCHCLHVSCVS